MSEIKVLVKISAKRKSKKGQTPQFIWNVGFQKSFVAELNTNKRFVKIQVVEDKLQVLIGEEGIRLSETAPGYTCWVSLGKNWIYNLQEPNANMDSLEFSGLLNLSSGIIILDQSYFPEMLLQAMSDKPLEYPKEPKTAIKKIANTKSSQVKEVVKRKTPTTSLISKNYKTIDITSKQDNLPKSGINWQNDRNVRNLQALLLDLQKNRKDIVIKEDEGVVSIKRVVHEDF